MANLTARAQLLGAMRSVESGDHDGLMRCALELMIYTGARDVDLYDEADNCYATLSLEFHDA